MLAYNIGLCYLKNHFKKKVKNHNVLNIFYERPGIDYRVATLLKLYLTVA